MKNFVLLFAILLLLTQSTISSYEATPTSKSFTVDLIHYDSPLSPMYNSSMTQSELLLNAASRSISRHNKSYNNNNNNATNNRFGYGSKVQAIIAPNSVGDYLMKVYLGSPPVERLVVVDTAADLSWIQCQPCEQCYEQDTPIFDPKSSHSYETPDCSSVSCKWLATGGCEDSSKCKYIEYYGDSSQSIGELAIDVIRFDPRETYYPNFAFGCGHYNVGRFSKQSSGLVGLGRGHLSLISQLGIYIGNKFSYCLNSVYDTGRPTTVSKLKFGSDSTISTIGRVTVPIMTEEYDSSSYNLLLDAVSVGNTKIVLQNTDTVTVDSGTTLTLLETSIYNTIESAIIKYTGLRPVSEPPTNYKLCFREGRGDFPYPSITFHFDGAESGLQMKSINMFGRLDNLICFMVVPHSQLSILGNMAQVNFEVEYDLDDRSVSFAPRDCSQA